MKLNFQAVGRERKKTKMYITIKYSVSCIVNSKKKSLLNFNLGGVRSIEFASLRIDFHQTRFHHYFLAIARLNWHPLDAVFSIYQFHPILSFSLILTV